MALLCHLVGRDLLRLQKVTYVTLKVERFLFPLIMSGSGVSGSEVSSFPKTIVNHSQEEFSVALLEVKVQMQRCHHLCPALSTVILLVDWHKCGKSLYGSKEEMSLAHKNC
jgi:hypothetical protein